jgi:two-component system catabolic regulation response regulator CreB
MGDSPRILLIEDEQSIADAVVWTLGKEGFEVSWAATIADGLSRLGDGFRLVLLDVGLPDGSGFDACRAIRSRSEIPVVFLSARGEEIDRVLGLEIGGDDYLVKPFSPRELAARVRARLRSHPPSATLPAPPDAPHPVEGTEFVHDAAARRFRFRGRELALTAAETRVLECLLAHPGRVVSRQELIDRALGEDSPSLERTIDAHVKSLRGKLREAAPDADPIETRRGFGYAARKNA